MLLKELREARGLSRKEVADASGISLRSLQDYEQGHKNITHAKGKTLYRLSVTLGCTMEELIVSYMLVSDGDGREQRQVDRLQKYQIAASLAVRELQKCVIFSRKYHVYGRWEFENDQCKLVFCHKGKVVELPFVAEFTEKMLPWLVETAVMMMEDYMEHEKLECIFSEFGGDDWDEW